jgi:uncharacterized membrane protein YccC
MATHGPPSLSDSVHGVVAWVKKHDPNYVALRRGARTAVVAPALFALSVKVIDNLQIATYAAFGSIALLMLVDFAGPMRARLQAQATLSAVGVVLIALGTLVSQTTWLSVVTMIVVAFVILFVGVLSSVLASATTSLLLVLTLSIAVSGPTSTIPDRLLGWLMASVVAFVAVWFFWPTKNENPLRSSAARASRALAASLRVGVDDWLGTGKFSKDERERVVSAAHDATTGLHRNFLSSQWRPTGLGVASRATVRLVDELLWIDTLVTSKPGDAVVTSGHRDACASRAASASVLEAGAALLEGSSTSASALANAQSDLHAATEAMERTATQKVPSPEVTREQSLPERGDAALEGPSDEVINEFVSSLDPGFRAQELGFGVSLVGANIDLATAADKRGWLDTLVGNQPGVTSGRFALARERAATHLDWRSVWLHNSVRGAIALAIAVFIAKEAGLQHSFWVILGTLSVLRSSAVSTGQNALRAVSGTLIGFVLGSLILALVGTNVTVLWFLFPLAILVAGFAPTAISFAAGQAGFTLTLVILYNVLEPVGWRVGLYRVEDVAIGCAVSVGVGLLFWPRGAAKALGATLRQAFDDASSYLVAAVAFATERTDGDSASTATLDHARAEAAASGRRLDDAFRSYLGERGSKPLPLAEVTALVRGVANLRQTADAVVNLWTDEENPARERSSARAELAREVSELQRWYEALGASLAGEGSIPVPAEESPESERQLLRAVRDDLRGDKGAASTAVRLIWTKDYLDSARRLEATLVDSARVAASSATIVPTKT